MPEETEDRIDFDDITEVDIPADVPGHTSIATALAEVKKEAAAEDAADTTPAEDAEDTTTLSDQKPEDNDKAADLAPDTAEEETTTDDFLNQEERTEYDTASVERKEEMLERKISESDKRFTQHSQDHAEKMRGLDELIQTRDAFVSNPRATLEHLAKSQGLQIVDPSQPQATTPAPTNGSQASVLPQSEAITQQAGEILQKTGYPPELAGPLLEIAGLVANQAVSPFQEHITKQQEKAVTSEIDSAVRTMTTKFGKEWESKSAEMDALSLKWPRGQGISMDDYLVGLYEQVRGPVDTQKTAAAAAAKAIHKVSRSESAAETLPASKGVASKAVATKPPENLLESWKQSKREMGGRR